LLKYVKSHILGNGVFFCGKNIEKMWYNIGGYL